MHPTTIMTTSTLDSTESALADQIYSATLAIREQAANTPCTRVGAQRLLRLAMDFDQRVAEARARAPEICAPASVHEVRRELLARQRLALTSLAERFFIRTARHWKPGMALVLGGLALILCAYAVVLFKYVDVPGLRHHDIALLALLGAGWPLAVSLLFLLYIVALHFAALAAGTGRGPRKASLTAADPWISTLIMANAQQCLAIAAAVAGLIVFAGVPILAQRVAAAEVGTLLPVPTQLGIQ